MINENNLNSYISKLSNYTFKQNISNYITIHGNNFYLNNIPPKIYLNNSEITPLSTSNNTIIIQLPQNIEHGKHTLTVLNYIEQNQQTIINYT